MNVCIDSPLSVRSTTAPHFSRTSQPKTAQACCPLCAARLVSPSPPLCWHAVLQPQLPIAAQLPSPPPRPPGGAVSPRRALRSSVVQRSHGRLALHSASNRSSSRRRKRMKSEYAWWPRGQQRNMQQLAQHARKRFCFFVFFDFWLTFPFVFFPLLSVCHTDAFTLSGEDPEGQFPVILGHVRLN